MSFLFLQLTTLLLCAVCFDQGNPPWSLSVLKKPIWSWFIPTNSTTPHWTNILPDSPPQVAHTCTPFELKKCPCSKKRTNGMKCFYRSAGLCVLTYNLLLLVHFRIEYDLSILFLLQGMGLLPVLSPPGCSLRPSIWLSSSIVNYLEGSISCTLSSPEN